MTLISGDAVADPSRLGRHRRRRGDEGARRRRQRVPARRGRRDLPATGTRQPADLPLRRRDREEPRRLGLARRPRATSTPTASSTCPTGGSTCSPSAAATSTRPRSSRRSPSTRRAVLLWPSACPTTISARCRTCWCRRRGDLDAADRAGFLVGAPGGLQGAAHRRVRRPAAARRRGQGAAIGGPRRRHRTDD